MKRLMALALSFALMLCVSTAFAWSCPNCGAAMENNFCTECGTKKPENICPGCGTNHGETVLNFCTECGTKMPGTMAPTSAPTATPASAPAISQVFENDNGTVSILWDADGETVYTIECVQRLSDDPWADRLAQNGFYTSKTKDDIGFYTIQRLIPGEQYWLGVFDEQGNGSFRAFVPTKEFGAFSEVPITLEGKLMTERDGVQAEAAAITVKDIDAGGKVGLYLAMAFDNPGEMKEYVTRIVIEAPGGVRWVMAGWVEFAAETSGVNGWRFLNLTDYFARMRACFGATATGDYSAAVYLNGALVGDCTFQVTE